MAGSANSMTARPPSPNWMVLTLPHCVVIWLTFSNVAVAGRLDTTTLQPGFLVGRAGCWGLEGGCEGDPTRGMDTRFPLPVLCAGAAGWGRAPPPLVSIVMRAGLGL